MGMALKSDVSEMCREDGNHRPVDLVHLSCQTMGDEELERDVLGIFVKQSSIYLKQLREAREAEVARQYAHQLKGAAKGIGAWELARIAEEVELSGKADLAAVESEITAVCDYIRVLGDR